MEQPVLITALEIPLAKMIYLLNFRVDAGQRNDKTRFWRGQLGFQDPEELRRVLLSMLSVDQLQRTGQNSYGWRYNAVIALTGPSGATWRVRTGWVVLHGESVARFVTAFPD